LVKKEAKKAKEFVKLLKIKEAAEKKLAKMEAAASKLNLEG